MNRLHLLTHVAAVAPLIVLPTAAFAQPYPYSHSDNDDRARQGQIGGVIAASWPYNLNLERGTHVDLHNGTVINPTGLTLRRGMRVRIFGYWRRDGSFEANEIDVRPRGGDWER
jgi:hypothetical protein